MADAGLRGQVHDAGDLVPGASGEALDRLEVGDIGLLEREARVPAQALEPRGLERRVVIAVEVVEPQHRLAAPEQGEAHVIADEARAAGDQDRHGARPVRDPPRAAFAPLRCGAASCRPRAPPP
jgi:hypothetical protein